MSADPSPRHLFADWSAKSTTPTAAMGKSGETLELPLSIAEFNHHVAALDVSEVMQTLTESLCHVGTTGQVDRKIAYSRDFGRLLWLGGERYGEEATHNAANEASPIDH